MVSLELVGATAVVTGASSGIGAALARELCARGTTRIVLLGRSLDRLEVLARELSCETMVECVDLCDARAIDGLLHRHPDIDILVNCAGVGMGMPLLEADGKQALAMVDLNCKAPLQLIHGWLPGMVARGRGGVLNVGSVAGYGPLPDMAAYSGTKAFLFVLSESLRIETRSTGVAVTLLAAGPVDTPFFDVAFAGLQKPPGWLFVTAEQVARAGLNGLERDRPVVLIGLIGRILAWHARLSPLWLQRPVMRLYRVVARWWLQR